MSDEDDKDNIVYGVNFTEPQKKEVLANKWFVLDGDADLHFIGDTPLSPENPEFKLMATWEEYIDGNGGDCIMVSGPVVARWLRCFLDNVVDPGDMEIEYEDDEEE